MAKLDLYLMYFCALVAMSVLYAPQPIAVLFESELGIARGRVQGFLSPHLQAKEHKGIANGLYVSFYYMGGALGSFLPGFIYNYLGWIAFLCSLGVVCALSLAFAIMLAKTRVYGVRNEN